MTEDFDVFEPAPARKAWERAKEATSTILSCSDVGLPTPTGVSCCRLMRKQGVKCPILMLTGHDSDADTILGLDAGANDYVNQPLPLSCPAGPHRARLRQQEQSEDAVFQLGPYTFKPANEDC